MFILFYKSENLVPSGRAGLELSPPDPSLMLSQESSERARYGNARKRLRQEGCCDYDVYLDYIEKSRPASLK